MYIITSLLIQELKELFYGRNVLPLNNSPHFDVKRNLDSESCTYIHRTVATYIIMQ